MGRQALGENVRTLRLKKKWTQKDLAKHAHVTENTIRGCERGTLHTRWPKLEAIARALGTTPEDLVRPDTEIAEGSPLLRGLGEEDLGIARQFHDAFTERRLAVRQLLSGTADAAIVLLDKFLRLDVVARALLLETIDQFLAKQQADANAKAAAERLKKS